METPQKRALFWDIDLEAMDLKQHKYFIIERILARGDADDFRWAEKAYGNGVLKETLLQAKTLDKKSLSFWCFYFNIDKQQCIQKPLLLKRSAFWKK
ncbi:MAG: hypothetical protein Q8Q10_03355 [bacterium]|nr:hypothetical protein [bacterium]